MRTNHRDPERIRDRQATTHLQGSHVEAVAPVIISDVQVPLAGSRLLDLDLRDGASVALLDRNSIQQLRLGQ